MPISSDLNISPYFDDFNQISDYYKILFQPGVAVQTRELNQLQTTLQNQIEKFGDNIYKQGTVVSGCNFVFNNQVSYVKINDLQTDKQQVNVDEYKNLLVRGNSSNIVAYIIDTVPGFNSTNPDLNTLYLRYQNSSSNNTVQYGITEFNDQEVLTIYSAKNSLYNVNVKNGSANFSNNDSVLFLSAISVTNSEGGSLFVNSTAGACTFSIGQVITNGIANCVITKIIDSPTEGKVLSIKPYNVDDLITTPVNTSKWIFNPVDNLSLYTDSASGVYDFRAKKVIGSGATATITTGFNGKISDINLTSGGVGYDVEPHVTIISSQATSSDYNSLSLEARNYIANVQIADVGASKGVGYFFGVTEGVIYQKGYFLRVSPQEVIVEKYNNQPNNKVVGFDSHESIIDSSVDESLFDNALGTPNYTAPGANRLKIQPKLVVVDKVIATANDSFFTIVEWSNGQPYKQNQETQFNIIGNEIAKRTYESAGNFSLDKFKITTKDVSSTEDNWNNLYKVVIDPGVAYISGNKVQSKTDFTKTLIKATNTVTKETQVTLNYGNYVVVDSVAGLFPYNTSEIVDFYNAPTQFYNNSLVSITPQGNKIGSARIRSFVYDSGGDPGTPFARYRIYLFDIKMESGKNFSDIRSIVYGSSAVGDCVLEQNSTTNEYVCVLKNPPNVKNQLIYSITTAAKSIPNITYNYKKNISFTGATSVNGQAVITLGSLDSNEKFPFTPQTNLIASQKNNIIIFPSSNTEYPLTGTVSVSGIGVVGSGTNFLNELYVGDNIKLGTNIRRVINISNNSSLTVNTAVSHTGSANSVIIQNVPIPLASRSDKEVIVGADSKTLTIKLGKDYPTFTGTAIVDITANSVPATTKTVLRDLYVKIQANTNVASVNGPWALGISDIFRLKGVWTGSNTTFNEIDGQNITSQFNIDHGQNEDFYDIGYLYKKPTSEYVVNQDDILLVKFDAFDNSDTGKYFSINSYPVDDTIPANTVLSSAFCNTLEIPEMFSKKDSYYDLRDCVDFRQMTANTVAYVTTAASAPINPPEPNPTTRFVNNTKYFPVPQSGMVIPNVESYVGRTDTAVVTANGEFNILNNVVVSSKDTMVINYIKVPPYPSLSEQMSYDMVAIADTKMISEKKTNQRLSAYQITTPISMGQATDNQPVAYTMERISGLEQRIKNLEYYVSLNLLELSVNNKIIPSSLDPNINRFKFGFFADNFKTQKFTDLTNPEYNATVLNNKLTAKKDQLNLEFKFSSNTTKSCVVGKMAVLPFQQYYVVEQLNATNGRVVDDSSTLTTPTQQTFTVPVKNQTLQFSIDTPVEESSYFLFSNTAGQATLYFDFLEDGPGDMLTIFQSSTQYGVESIVPVNPLNLSVADRTSLTSNGALSGFTSPEYRTSGDWTISNRPNYSTQNINGFNCIKNAGKFSWIHDPTKGRYYRILVQKLSPKYTYYINYPIDVLDTTINSTNINKCIGYNGVFSVTPSSFSLINKVLINSGGATLNFDFSVENGMLHSIATGDYISLEMIKGSTGDEYYAINNTVGHEGWADLIPESKIGPLPGLQYLNTIGYKTDYINAEHVFNITITGLRPLTNHKFIYDSEDMSLNCRPAGGIMGDGLISRRDGTLTFDFFYNLSKQLNGAGVDIPNSIVQSEFNKYKEYIARKAGKKVMRVENYDKTSTAETTIEAISALLPSAYIASMLPPQTYF